MSNCISCNTETTNPKFCNRSCAATYNNKISPKRKVGQYSQYDIDSRKLQTLRECPVCKSPTTNPKYCSTRCYSSIATPPINGKGNTSKREISRRLCIDCGKPTENSQKARCQTHLTEYKQEKYKILTIGDYRNRESVVGKHRSWLHGSIRNFARSWLKHLTVLPCAHCGYDKHVELCHIKGVSTFEDSALLGEVNSEENVIQLCRNCHWEFDNLPRNLEGQTGIEPA